MRHLHFDGSTEEGALVIFCNSFLSRGHIAESLHGFETSKGCKSREKGRGGGGGADEDQQDV